MARKFGLDENAAFMAAIEHLYDQQKAETAPSHPLEAAGSGIAQMSTLGPDDAGSLEAGAELGWIGCGKAPPGKTTAGQQGSGELAALIAGRAPKRVRLSLTPVGVEQGALGQQLARMVADRKPATPKKAKPLARLGLATNDDDAEAAGLELADIALGRR
jgi:hypothetical protein